MASTYGPAIERNIDELHDHRNRMFDKVVKAFVEHDVRLFNYASQRIDQSTDTLRELETMQEQSRPNAARLGDLIKEVKLAGYALEYSECFIENNEND